MDHAQQLKYNNFIYEKINILALDMCYITCTFYYYHKHLSVSICKDKDNYLFLDSLIVLKDYKYFCYLKFHIEKLFFSVHCIFGLKVNIYLVLETLNTYYTQVEVLNVTKITIYAIFFKF